MDMQMPEMGWVEATKAIRLLENKKETPIIALTANATKSDQKICFESGMNRFSSKPIRLNLFAREIAVHLESLDQKQQNLPK